MQSLPCKVALLSILLAFCVNSQGLPFYFDPLGKLGGSNAWSPLSLSPVAWWKADGNALDSSSSGFNAAWYGTAAYTNGINGLAYAFNGSTAVTNAFNSSLATTNTTVCFWANCKGGSGLRVTASMRQISPARGWYTVVSADNAWVSSFADSDRGFWAVGTNPVSNFVWAHIAQVYSLTNKTIYVNGVPAGTSVNPYTPPTTSLFMVGALSDGGPRLYFTGAVDDILVFNRALSESDIAQIYNWRQ